MPDEPIQKQYKESEGLKVEGKELSEGDKTAKDSGEATAAAEKMLKAAREGVFRLPDGTERKLPAELQKKLTEDFLKTINDKFVKAFDQDGKPGLDEQEWNNLEKAIDREVNIWLAKAAIPTKENPVGFAGLEKTKRPWSDISDRFTAEQKLSMLQALPELLDQQQRRIEQLQIIKIALESLASDIKTSRTWNEWLTQALTERDATTEARSRNIEKMISDLEVAMVTISQDPTKTVDDVLGTKIKNFLTLYGLQEKVTKQNEKHNFLLDLKGKIKDADTAEALKEQHLALMTFLRGMKDYASAQALVETKIFNKQFEERRMEMDSEGFGGKSEEKINGMVNAEQREAWKQSGMTDAQCNAYIKELVDDDIQREMNKRIAKENNGIPFKNLEGSDEQVMLAYKDMMGTGEWHNFSDQTWNTIVDELIINAPLIIISGATASAARAGLSAGARAVVRRTGINAGGKALRAVGLVAGQVAEGATFSVVHKALQGKNLFAENWKDILKEIAWSTITLGAFHQSGKLAASFDKAFAENITKVAKGSLGATVQSFLIKMPTETVTMVLTGAAQHFTEYGNLIDFDLAEQMFHAAVSVGALKVSGSVISPVIQKGKMPPKFLEGRSDKYIFEPTTIDAHPVDQSEASLSSVTKPGKRSAKIKPPRAGPEERSYEEIARKSTEQIPEHHETAVAEAKSLLVKVRAENNENVANALREGIKRMENNEPASDNTTRLLEGLRDRDPQGYEILKKGDIDFLVESQCLDGIISRNIFITEQKQTAYFGKPIAAGGVGQVHFVTMLTKDGKVEMGAFKEKHDLTQTALFKEKMEKYERDLKDFNEKRIAEKPERPVSGQDSINNLFEIERYAAIHAPSHPNIIRTIETGQDYIIYETARGSVDLSKAFDKLSPVEYIDALEGGWQSLEGVYRQFGKGEGGRVAFCGDFSLQNLLQMPKQDGIGYDTKQIDNSFMNSHLIEIFAKQYEEYGKQGKTISFNWPHKKAYSYEPEQVIEALRKGQTPESIAEAVDNYAFARSVEAVIVKKFPQLATRGEHWEIIIENREIKDALDTIKDIQNGRKAKVAEAVEELFELLRKEAATVPSESLTPPKETELSQQAPMQ